MPRRRSQESDQTLVEQSTSMMKNSTRGSYSSHATSRKSGAARLSMGAGALSGSDDEKNAAPSQWGRRLARAVGEKFGVRMSENWSKNEGTYRKKEIVIKCAKSLMPPVSVLVPMLERVDELWAVYVTPEGGAEVWAVPIDKVREYGYFTRGPNVQKRVEIYHRKVKLIGKRIGTLSPAEVEQCRIP